MFTEWFMLIYYFYSFSSTNITNPYDVSRLDILLFLSFNKYVNVISSVMHAF